jgi:streptomycin 6-kinase
MTSRSKTGLDPRLSGDGSLFAPYLTRWALVADGTPITTHASHLLPVRRHGRAAMLKLAMSAEEQAGGAVLQWWGGEGAAEVFARDADAILMERAKGAASLTEMAHAGRDDEACHILCAVAARLHAPRLASPPPVVPLAQMFRDLDIAAAKHGGVFARSAETARTLLASPREVCVLHGDVHHDNVLDFGARGWRAIDPKALIGERGFDFANIFTNPDLADLSRPVATDPARFARRVAVVSEAACVAPARLLQWIVAWTGLSASWFLDDDDTAHAAIDLRIAELALAALAR